MRQELAKEGLYGGLEFHTASIKRSDLALIPVPSAGANGSVWGTEHQLRDRQFERRPSVSMAVWTVVTTIAAEVPITIAKHPVHARFRSTRFLT